NGRSQDRGETSAVRDRRRGYVERGSRENRPRRQFPLAILASLAYCAPTLSSPTVTSGTERPSSGDIELVDAEAFSLRAGPDSRLVYRLCFRLGGDRITGSVRGDRRHGVRLPDATAHSVFRGPVVHCLESVLIRRTGHSQGCRRWIRTGTDASRAG